METESVKERRLELEANTTLLGTLGDRESFTDAAQVFVTYADADEVEHAGYYIVRVRTEIRDGMSEEEQLAAHPATLAQAAVEVELERRAQWDGWTYSSVDDVYAY